MAPPYVGEYTQHVTGGIILNIAHIKKVSISFLTLLQGISQHYFLLCSRVKLFDQPPVIAVGGDFLLVEGVRWIYEGANI